MTFRDTYAMPNAGMNRVQDILSQTTFHFVHVKSLSDSDCTISYDITEFK